jgi:hypothetical protein
MDLPAIGTDATESAARPGFAHGPDKETLFAAFVEQRMIRGWQMENLGASTGSGG